MQLLPKENNAMVTSGHFHIGDDDGKEEEGLMQCIAGYHHMTCHDMLVFHIGIIICHDMLVIY